MRVSFRLFLLLCLFFSIQNSFAAMENFSDDDSDGERLDLHQAFQSHPPVPGVDRGIQDFRNANLNGANLSDRDLSGADFTGAKLNGVNFARSNLTNAVFNNAELRGTTFDGTILHCTRFKERMGTGLKIARDNGARYELYSEVPIPPEIKDWLIKKGITFVEFLEGK